VDTGWSSSGLPGATQYSRDEGDEWRSRSVPIRAFEGMTRFLKNPYSYRTFRDRRRPEGIASTMRQSPIITIPMNSNAKASTAILPDKPIELWKRVDRFLICGTGGEMRSADGGRALKEFG
jgi:hypothetical protein